MARALLLSLVLLAVGAGCANMEPPPGGPEDRMPPGIVATVPEDDSVLPGFDEAVVFDFDERITRQGITDAVSVSPRTSPVQVAHGRSSIRVNLREGWVPGIVYHVAVLSTVRDLFGNALPAPHRIVFSTGPELPETWVGGSVRDRITGQPAIGVRVEAIRMADSLVYVVPTDSAGGFGLDRIPDGEYQVRAFPDANQDRELGYFEARDSSFVTIGPADTVQVALRLLEPDSTAPVVESVTPDSAAIEIRFDDYLDPAQELSVEQVAVVHPTAGALPVESISMGDPAPGAAAVAGAGGDPLPSRSLRVHLPPETELEPGVEYGISTTGIVNVNGVSGDAAATLEIDPPPESP